MAHHPALEDVSECFLCGDARSRRLFAIGPYGYHACAQCGLVRLAPRPRPADLDRLYATEWAYSADLIPETGGAEVNPSYPYRLARLDRFAPGRRFYEIGCGDGSFLAYLRARGWAVAGGEASVSGIAAAAARWGLAADRLSFEGLSLPGVSDAIGLYHVLEHLYQPRAALAAIAGALQSGGILHVQVPNRRSFDARLGRDRWPGLLCPQHAYLYEPRHLERLLSDSFRVVSVETYDPWHGPVSVEVTLRGLIRRWLRGDPRSGAIPTRPEVSGAGPAGGNTAPVRLRRIAVRAAATAIARAQAAIGWGNVIDVIATRR